MTRFARVHAQLKREHEWSPTAFALIRGMSSFARHCASKIARTEITTQFFSASVRRKLRKKLTCVVFLYWSSTCITLIMYGSHTPLISTHAATLFSTIVWTSSGSTAPPCCVNISMHTFIAAESSHARTNTLVNLTKTCGKRRKGLWKKTRAKSVSMRSQCFGVSVPKAPSASTTTRKRWYCLERDSFLYLHSEANRPHVRTKAEVKIAAVRACCLLALARSNHRT